MPVPIRRPPGTLSYCKLDTKVCTVDTMRLLSERLLMTAAMNQFPMSAPCQRVQAVTIMFTGKFAFLGFASGFNALTLRDQLHLCMHP